MNFEELLREEHNYLKNQITELKNAFDINRDILNILTKQNFKEDPEHSIFLKIISKLTALNTQAMMSTCELMQEKNALKAEIYRLNVQLNQLEERLEQEINKNNQMVSTPTEARLLLHEQFNKLNRQLLAFNEEKMDYEQQIAYWKQNCVNNKKPENRTYHGEITGPFARKCRVKRKYTSIQNTKNDWILNEQQLQIKRLNKVIEQLENRTLLLIRAHNLQQQSSKKKEHVVRYKQQWEKQLEEIGLFKYALNVITVKKQDDDLFMNIKHRFRHHIDPSQRKKRNVHSWPKYKEFKYDNSPRQYGNKVLQKTWHTEDSK